MSKATPRPWRQEGQYPSYPELGLKRYIVDAATGMEIACCQHRVQGIGARSEAEANAELIVRAVNCHEELVSFLEKQLSNDHDFSYPETLFLEELLKRAKGEV